MAKLQFDLSGRKGLAPRHQGDFNDTAKANDRYLGREGQMASGIWNPFKNYGYLSPGINTRTDLTGTVSNLPVATVYDTNNDDIYFGDNGPNFLRLDGADDTTLTTSLTIDADRDIIDMELYEVSGKRAVAYLTDSSDFPDNMSVGFYSLTSESGARVFDNPVAGVAADVTIEYISEFSGVVAFAQRIDGINFTNAYRDFDRVRLRLTRFGAGTSYTIRVGIQSDSDGAPDGTYVASGTIDPADVPIATELEGTDIYVDLDVTHTANVGNFWLVVEPTDILDMTGTNSFGWIRSDAGNTTYSNGEAFEATTGPVWAQADGTSESWDFSLILTETENWFPLNDPGLYATTTLGSRLTFETTDRGEYNNALKIDLTHYINVWQGDGNDGFVGTFSVNVETGAITAIDELEYDIAQSDFNRIVQLDSDDYMIVWRTSTGAGLAQVFTVDGSYNITANGSAFTFETGSVSSAIVAVTIDSTHVQVWWDDGSNGQTVVLEVDGSKAVSKLGSDFQFVIGNFGGGEAHLLESDKTILFFEGPGSDGFAEVFDVSTLSSVTSAATALEFDTTEGEFISSAKVDDNHYLIAYQGGASSNGVLRVLGVNLTTYAVTTTTGPFEFEIDVFSQSSIATLSEFLNVYTIAYRSNQIGYMRVVTVDPTSYEILLRSDTFQIDTEMLDPSFVAIDDKNVIGFWYSQTDDLGYARTFYIDVSYSTNAFRVEEGQTSFIRRADNGLLYWYVGNTVHIIDGSATGGATGSITKEVLVFPSYTQFVDAVDFNGQFYVGIHSLKSATGDADNRMFPSDIAGVYIWDRQSSVVRNRDFIPIQGVREIKRLFITRDGQVAVIVINNSKVCELRILSNGRFNTVEKFEFGGYPEYRNSLTYIGELAVWLGSNGILYAYGRSEYTEAPALFKLADFSSFATGTFASGVLSMANTDADNEVALYVSYSDDSTHRISKVYIVGDTTEDSITQTRNQGDIYTLVKYLPDMSTVNDIDIFMRNNGTSTDTTTVANIKIYFNQEDTHWAIKPISVFDMSKGKINIPVGKPYIHSVQLEIEYVTTPNTEGDFQPSIALVDYTPTTGKNR